MVELGAERREHEPQQQGPLRAFAVNGGQVLGVHRWRPVKAHLSQHGRMGAVATEGCADPDVHVAHRARVLIGCRIRRRAVNQRLAQLGPEE